MDTDSHPIVVGFDGSPPAVNALRWAVAEAVARDVPLRLTRVLGEGTPPADLDATRRALAEAGDALVAQSPNLRVQTCATRGGVADVLLAQSHAAAMICVGSDGYCVGRPLGALATTLAQHAGCDVAVIKDCPDSPTTDPGVVAVVLDDEADDDERVHQAMREGRLRHTSVRQIDRRADSWVRRYPDVHVETVAAGTGFPAPGSPDRRPPQLAVVGRGDAEQLADLATPNCHPIVGFPDCSVLVVRR